MQEFSPFDSVLIVSYLEDRKHCTLLRYIALVCMFYTLHRCIACYALYLYNLNCLIAHKSYALIAFAAKKIGFGCLRGDLNVGHCLSVKLILSISDCYLSFSFRIIIVCAAVSCNDMRCRICCARTCLGSVVICENM